MAGIQLTGLASGLDWKTLVDQIMVANSTGVTRLQTEQTKVGQQTTVLNTIKSQLSDLQTSLASLNDPTAFTQRTATSSSARWTVAGQSGATAMTHSIAVAHLASAASLRGSGNLSSAIRADGDASQVLISAMNLAQPITAGTFTVNGAKVVVAVTDTLADVFQKISDATRANGNAVTASYSGADDQITLSGSGPIVLGAANDTSNFLQALKLNNNNGATVTSATRLGALNLDAPLGSAGLAGNLSLDADNAGTLLVNGVSIDYDADTDSLRTVMARINASSAGVTASYDAANDRMVIANNITGDLGVSVQDGLGGNLGSVLGLTGASATLIHGQNAQFTVDGGASRTSSSNVLDAATLGVSGLTVTIGSETTESVTVGSDTGSARSKIEDFISKFNAVLAYVDAQTKLTTTGTKTTAALMYGDTSVKNVTNSLRSEVFKALGGAGSIQRLDSLGIDFDGTTNVLKIKDSAKLDTALLNKSTDVADFFTNSSTGLVTRLNAVINNQTGATGSLTTDLGTKTTRTSSIATQIINLQRRLDQQRASLEASFIQMEQMQSNLKGQLDALNSAFGSTSSSSSTSK